jgi:uncharacterized damage-inducible protein DinB
MEQNLDQTVALLARTPAALDALLRDLLEAWTENNEGEGTWSVCTVVAHLIHAEHEDWMPRAKMILQSRETRTFEPFDREGHERFANNKTMRQLLDEFSRVRAQSLDGLKALRLTPDDLKRCGRHPALGRVTLSELLATWAAHDLTHLHQIVRILAHQYREAVGPWARFLGVMQCSGHSAAA